MIPPAAVPYLIGVAAAPLLVKVLKPLLRGTVKATVGVAFQVKQLAAEAAVEFQDRTAEASAEKPAGASTTATTSRSTASRSAAPSATTAPTAAPVSPAPLPPPARLVVSALDCKNELVAITNEGQSAVDLGGWKIHDRNSEHTYAFQPGTTLAPGATVSVRSGKTKPKPDEIAWTNRNVWNDTGDTATLVDPSGAEVSIRTV